MQGHSCMGPWQTPVRLPCPRGASACHLARVKACRVLVFSTVMPAGTECFLLPGICVISKFSHNPHYSL